MRFRNIFASSTIVCLSLGGRWLNLYCTKLFTLKRREGDLFMQLSNPERPLSQHQWWSLAKEQTVLYSQKPFSIRKTGMPRGKHAWGHSPWKATQRLGLQFLSSLQLWASKEKNPNSGLKRPNPQTIKHGYFAEELLLYSHNRSSHIMRLVDKYVFTFTKF